MIPTGFMAKRVLTRPNWLKNSAVYDIFSVSGCISRDFCDYIKHWKHNGFWMFNSPDAIRDIAVAESIDLSQTRLFYYEVYERQYVEERKEWTAFESERRFETNVLVPGQRQLEGYDVVTFSVQTSPECSPLSCNGLAESIAVNRHCLLTSLDDAKRHIESGSFDNSEPGPFRIFAVLTCASV